MKMAWRISARPFLITNPVNSVLCCAGSAEYHVVVVYAFNRAFFDGDIAAFVCCFDSPVEDCSDRAGLVHDNADAIDFDGADRFAASARVAERQVRIDFPLVYPDCARGARKSVLLLDEAYLLAPGQPRRRGAYCCAEAEALAENGTDLRS